MSDVKQLESWTVPFWQRVYEYRVQIGCPSAVKHADHAIAVIPPPPPPEDLETWSESEFWKQIYIASENNTTIADQAVEELRKRVGEKS